MLVVLVVVWKEVLTDLLLVWWRARMKLLQHLLLLLRVLVAVAFMDHQALMWAKEVPLHLLSRSHLPRVNSKRVAVAALALECRKKTLVPRLGQPWPESQLAWSTLWRKVRQQPLPKTVHRMLAAHLPLHCLDLDQSWMAAVCSREKEVVVVANVPKDLVQKRLPLFLEVWRKQHQRRRAEISSRVLNSLWYPRVVVAFHHHCQEQWETLKLLRPKQKGVLNNLSSSSL